MIKIHKNLLSLIPINNVLAICLTICCYSFSRAQSPNIQWQRCFGGSDWDSFGSVLQLSGGNFIVNGNSSSNDFDVSGNHGDNDIWIVKLDPLGNLINQKCLGGTNTDIFNNFILLPNEHLIFAGGTMSNNGDVTGNHSGNSFDGWLVETDTSFNIIRQRCFGGTNNEGFNSVRQTYDGGLILSGITNSSDGDLSGVLSHGGGDIWVLKLDSAWNIEWEKCYGGSFDDYGVDIIPIFGNGYLIGSYAGSFDGDVSAPIGGYDFWILKVDSIGNLTMEKSYGGTSDEYLYSVLNTNDSGFILAGYTSSQDGFVSGSHDTIFGVSDYWILKVDSLANFQWQTCLGGSREDEAGSVIKDYGNGFIVNGFSNSSDGNVSGNHGTSCFPYPCEDIWLTRIDSSGSLQWQKCLGGTLSDISSYCSLTADSGYVVVGYTFSIDGVAIGSLNHGNTDSWFIKLSPLQDGITVISNSISDFSCFLDQSNWTLVVKYYTNSRNPTYLKLFDITGRLLLTQNLAGSTGFNNQKVYTGELNTDVYFVILTTEVGTVTKKLIVE